MSQANTSNTVDFTPTWGEWGNIYQHFARSGEAKALQELAPDFARAMAAAEAFKAIQATLTDEQAEIFSKVFNVELGKQGF